MARAAPRQPVASSTSRRPSSTACGPAVRPFSDATDGRPRSGLLSASKGVRQQATKRVRPDDGRRSCGIPISNSCELSRRTVRVRSRAGSPPSLRESPPAIRPSVGVRSNNAVNSATGGAEGAESGVATIRANAPVKIAHAEPWIGTTCRMSGGKAPVAWLLAHAALSGAVHGGYESDVWREDLAELNRITA